MRTRTEHYYLFGPFRLDPAECRLQKDGGLIPLTPKTFALLLMLVRNSGSLIEKEVLMQELWPDSFVEEANLTFSVSIIRKALGESARNSNYIETVPKRGYRFNATVKEVRTEEPVKSLAVLPFSNVGANEASEYVAVGMQDALISELAQIRSLRVISRTSAAQYKKRSPVLQLDFAVEGTVLLEGERARINVRLIDAHNDQHLWAQSYERHLRDVLAWQSEVARSIVQQIQVKVTPREEARRRENQAINPEAHAAYLRGVYYWHQSFTETAFNTAIGHLRHAIDLDPGHARAWSVLAACFVAMAVQSMARPKEAVKEARHAAERALLLDPSLAEAHLSMAAIELFFGWDWAATERELKDALDLSPSLSMAHSLLACYAVARGWAERAVNSALRALDLDPISPTINTDVAWVHLLNGQYDKAKEQALSTIDMKVDYPLLHVYLGQVYLSTREYETAIQEIKKALPANGDEPAPILAMLGFAYAVAGKKEAARNVVRRMDALSKRTFISGYDWAVLHTGLGEKAAAIRCLKQALRERSPRVIWLNVEPAFDRLRGNREFKEMVRRLGVQ